MGSSVHITGGCGYVGSRLAARLAEMGRSVVVVDKATPEERGVRFPAGVEFRHADLTDRELAQMVLRDAKTVFHFAANIGSVNYMWEHQAEILNENAAIDAAVYPALQAANCELVIYSSTSMVHQHSPRYPYAESDLANTPPPSNVYGFSKLIGEYFCRAFAEQYGGPRYVILRYHNIYGPGEDAKGSTLGDIHVIPALLEKVFRGQYPVPLIGSGDATRPFTYVDDAVDMTLALFAAAESSDARVLNTDFNIADERSLSIRELAALIWRLFGDERPFALVETESKAASHTSLRREANVEKLRSIIGQRTNVSIEEGIARTAEWVRSKIAI